jgi:lysophospholipase L1-like esterase
VLWQGEQQLAGEPVTPGKYEPLILTCGLGRPRFRPFLWLVLALALTGTALRADLVLTNYSASHRLKVMASGDSITDDSSINGAWRSYLQPLLQTNGYAFTNLGRWISTTTPTFTLTRHEGMDGAVIGNPGLSPAHGYPASSNYARPSLADALTNVTPDLFLIDLGVNDMGRGRNPYFVATNDMAGLLDMIFAKAPAANIIIGKPTSITYASILSYLTYGTNMPIFCAALQSLVNARRAQGQNVFVADLFSAVTSPSMMKSDGTHPIATGLTAMANEWLFRIDAITVRTDRVVTPFIAGGSAWKYSDQGLDLGTNWAQVQYDDSAWVAGPARLGYNLPGVTTTVSFGTNSTNKYITTYFRRAFVAPAGVLYTNLNLRLNRVDGAVLRLNGQEIFRTNLPSGPVAFLTQATNSVTGDPMHTYFPANVRISGLPSGTNVVAVEIHKSSPSQASLSFDLELFGSGQFAPRLTASREGADFVVRWPATNNGGYILLSGTNLFQPTSWLPLGGPYLLNGGSYEYREPLIQSQSANFYRLQYVGVPATGPTLGCILNSNALEFSWPTGFAGFNLETCTGLPPASAWQTVSGPYPLSNGCFGVSVPRATGPQQFFRLRKPLR